jgi:hypothetical protein
MYYGDQNREYHVKFLSDIRRRTVEPGAYPKFKFGPLLTLDFGDYLAHGMNNVTIQQVNLEENGHVMLVNLESVFFIEEGARAHRYQDINISSVYDPESFRLEAKEIVTRGFFALRGPGNCGFDIKTPNKLSEEALKYLSELPLINSEFEFEKYQKAALIYLQSKNVPLARAETKAESQEDSPKVLNFRTA